MNAAQMVDYFNRQLHPDQINRIRQKNKNDSEKAEDELAVLCYMQNCKIDGTNGQLGGDAATMYQRGANLKVSDPQRFNQLSIEIKMIRCCCQAGLPTIISPWQG